MGLQVAEQGERVQRPGDGLGDLDRARAAAVGGRVGSPGMTAYQSAKWAVGGFSEALAAEVAPLGIKLTVLEPGGMRTDWGGVSMSTPPISEPYEATVGASARSTDHDEAGDAWRLQRGKSLPDVRA